MIRASLPESSQVQHPQQKSLAGHHFRLHSHSTTNKNQSTYSQTQNGTKLVTTSKQVRYGEGTETNSKTKQNKRILFPKQHLSKIQMNLDTQSVSTCKSPTNSQNEKKASNFTHFSTYNFSHTNVNTKCNFVSQKANIRSTLLSNFTLK